MMRLTKKADYALLAMKCLAEHNERSSLSAKDIADEYHIPQQVLAKLLQRLTKAGLLVSHAGTHGGYSLARRGDEISAFEVIRAIDGPLFITSCFTIHGECDLTHSCTIKEPLRKVNDTIRDVLSAMRLSDLRESEVEAKQELVSLR
jgi:Rrf2 family protein